MITTKSILNNLYRILPEFLKTARWFAGKGKRIHSVRISDYFIHKEKGGYFALLFVNVTFQEKNKDIYFVPLIIRKAAKGLNTGGLYFSDRSYGRFVVEDGFTNKRLTKWFMKFYLKKTVIKTRHGVIRFNKDPSGGFERARLDKIKYIKTEQSNSSVVFDDKYIHKIFRRVEPGLSPESEIPVFLNNHGFKRVPQVYARSFYKSNYGSKASIGVVQHYVDNLGDGWEYTLKSLEKYFKKFIQSKDEPGREQIVDYLARQMCEYSLLGNLTGEMHVKLACDYKEESFRPQTVTGKDITAWSGRFDAFIVKATEALGHKSFYANKPGLSERLQIILSKITGLKNNKEALKNLTKHSLSKIRGHGDYHLGQVLKSGNDWIVIDFEGEPLRSLEERRKKVCPLKDVAGMLRSFDYALHVVMRGLDDKNTNRAETIKRLGGIWRNETRKYFLQSYFNTASRGKSKFIARDVEVNMSLIAFFEIEKAVYELLYEMRNRPDWIHVPLKGLEDILT